MRTIFKRVLVVDDDLDHRNICVAILRHHLYEVLEATNGEDAVRIATDQRPDIILMDAVLPVLDGWTATERLKRGDQTAHIPVVMITASVLEPDRERGRQAGADSYLEKPCEPIRIVEEVHRFIGPAHAANGSEPPFLKDGRVQG